MMRVSREFLLLLVVISIGVIALIFDVHITSDVKQKTLNYKDQCTKLAASDWDKPNGVEPVLYDEIETDAAIGACSKAVELDPSSKRLKYYLARSIESAQSMESILHAEEILLELSKLEYAPALYHLYYFYELYPQFGKSNDEKLSFLRSAADLDLSPAVNDYIFILSSEDNASFNPDVAKIYEGRAIAAGNLELFSERPELFFEELNDWQTCYATVLAHTGKSRASLIFYQPDQVSFRGFELPDMTELSPDDQKPISKVCEKLKYKTAYNARDLALKLSLPYLLNFEAMSATLILDTLKKHESMPDFAFLVAGFWYYHRIDTDTKYMTSSVELEKYLLEKMVSFLNSDDLYEFAHGLIFVEVLEYRGLAPSFASSFTSADFLEKFRRVNEEYPGFMHALIWDNHRSFNNLTTYEADIFDEKIKYDYFCEPIVEIGSDMTLSFSLEKLMQEQIPGFDEEANFGLLEFCYEYSDKDQLSKLKAIAINANEAHYIYSQDSNMVDYAKQLSEEYSKHDVSTHLLLFGDSEFTRRNYTVISFVRNIMPHQELNYFDVEFLKKALISRDFLANPLMLLDYAMEVDRFLDNNKSFTSLVAKYLDDNFPHLLPDDYQNSATTCRERFQKLRSTSPVSFSITPKFFNNISVQLYIDSILDFSLKNREISMSLTTYEDIIDVNTFSLSNNDNCQEMLIDNNGNPTLSTSRIGYANSLNEVSYDFRSSVSRPEILLSNFFIKDFRVGRETRRNLELVFDPSSLKLDRYPFINGEINIPLDVIVKSQANRYVTLGIDDTLSEEVGGLQVKLERVDGSQRANYNDALEADIVLSVTNKYIIQLLKIVFPILVLASVALTTLPRQKATSDEAQLSLASAVMLSVIAYQFVVNALLPELPFLTALDYFIYALFVSAAFSVVSNVILHIEYFDKHPKQEKLLVLLSNLSAIAFYSLGIMVLLIAWYKSVYY